MNPVLFTALFLFVIVSVGGGFFFFVRWRRKQYLLNALDLRLLHVKLTLRRKKEDQKDFKEDINLSAQLFSILSGAKKPFVFEASVHHIGEDINFYVAVPRDMVNFASRQIEGLWQDAQVIETSEYNIFNPQGASVGCYVSQKENYALPIRTYAESGVDTFAPILSGLSKIGEVGEGVMIQVIARPVGSETKKKLAGHIASLKKGISRKDALEHGFSLATKNAKEAFVPKSDKQDPNKKPEPVVIDEDAVKALMEKASKPLLSVNFRIVSSAPSEYQAREILQGVASNFDQFTSPSRNELRVKKPKNLQNFIFEASFREFNRSQEMILNTEELASLFHFPTFTTAVPKVSWLKAKESAPPTNLPSSGTLIGESAFRGEHEPVSITDEDRRRHVYIVGQTGTGKSTLINNMVVRDIYDGKGVGVIDPHGDLIDSILARIPIARADDVIVFDPSDYWRPMGMNMLEYHEDHPEEKTFIVNEMQSIFNRLFSQETMGPMFEQYMRNSLLLLMEDAQNEPATLMEVPRVFTDSSYRERKLARISNPTVIDFWTKEASRVSGEASLANMTPYITSKFGNFISNDYMRPIIGQTKSAFNFRKMMDEGKILLVNLSKGRLGDINSNLLGMVMTGKILMAALSRVDIPEDKRRDFYLYIDEFQNFTTDSIATILSEARKYHLSLVIAHQFIAQLAENIRDAVLGNAGSIISFRVGPEDTEILKKKFDPIFSENDLSNIDNFNAYVNLLINGQTSTPFNIKIFPKDDGNSEFGQKLKELSREKYGRDRKEIENEILGRLRG